MTMKNNKKKTKKRLTVNKGMCGFLSLSGSLIAFGELLAGYIIVFGS